MSTQLPAYHSVLLKYVSLFILLPIFLIFVYVFHNLFSENINQAQNSVDEHATATASEIRAELSNLENQLFKLVNNRAISEVPVNILFSQNAQVTLQRFVIDNPMVKGVFIQDDSGFIIEAWPVNWLGIASENMNIYTLEAMEANYQDNEVRLLWLTPDQYSNLASKKPTLNLNRPKKVVDNHNEHLLVMSTATFAETDSIIAPFKATGTANVIIGLEEILSQRDNNNEASASNTHNLYLKSANKVIKTLQEKQFKTPLSGTQSTNVLLEQYASRSVLNVTVEYNKDALISDFWWTTIVQILPLLLVLPLMLWGLVKLTKNLNRPINQMVELCRNFASGNYTARDDTDTQYEARYREFDLLFRRMNNMASTISKQINHLEREKDRAETSEKIKSQFLANMSHEIRTPMNGVLGMLQLLEAEALADEQKEKVKIAKTSAQNLLNVINDILDISKIEANKLEIEQVSCNVAELVQDQIETLQLAAKKRNNVLKGLIKPPFHPYWKTDPTRLIQILTNLTSNAIKFTQNGKVMVILAQPAENQICLTVKDTGIGIPREKLGTLFQPFQQADTSTTREYGGTGLGLSITKNLCELMNGCLTVDSSLGEGSTFVATIEAMPSDSFEHNQQHVTITPSEPHRLEGKVAVIAEDNVINQEVLKAMLADYPIALHFAENGRDAVTLVEYFNPDIIFMDVHMPIMDGVEATQKIRALNVETPIVMQTANVMNEDVEHYMASGANDVIAKPIVKDELGNALKKWL
jgi:signal transduction histidine kinase/CheY-like chemotaxis protein